MGKRWRRRSRSPNSSILSDSDLLQRITSSNLPSDPLALNVDTVVHHLRSRYPDYARIKLQPFTLRVQRTLGSLRRHPSADDEDEDDNDSTSTSDDAGEPEFDILKLQLRDSYGKRVKLGEVKEDNVEIDATAKESRFVGLFDGGGGGSGVETPVVEKGRGGGGEINNGEEGRQGPRFRDLGGMNGVLEELMMEVIVPLCHPQLPQWLGVRPLAGILLHGPPGCGKTKLAQAIANETGVPFYKISATEVVSGVAGKIQLQLVLLSYSFYQFTHLS